MPFPVDWRLPNIKFPWSSEYFMQFPVTFFSELGLHPPVEVEGIENMWFCSLGHSTEFSIMIVFHKLAPQPIPLLYKGSVTKHEVYVQFRISYKSEEKYFFYKLSPTPHPSGWGLWTWVSVHILTFHSILRKYFLGKTSHTSTHLWRVKDWKKCLFRTVLGISYKL